ncbi:MAG TPA: hypothetical protein VJ161_09060 [Geobacteraceae bacterium]|nr:hypothetical protein [Geobacteraceae bacterium]
MRKLTILPLLVLLLCAAIPVSAKVSAVPGADIQGEATREFEEILDLWRDGNHEELYRRTTAAGKQSKESFVKRLASCDRRPACCWEKMQDVTVSAKDASRVTVHAKIGMDVRGGSTEFQTRKFKLEKEDGLWKISAADLLSLAGNGKKR